MPPASGLGLDHLNTIPATYQDALKKATILLDRTLRWRRICFLYEMGERETRRKRCRPWPNETQSWNGGIRKTSRIFSDCNAGFGRS